MKISHSILVFFILASMIACKSEFEKIRQSNDPDLVLTKANAYYEEGEYIKAQTLYEIAIASFRGQKEAEDLFFKYAYTHYHTNQYILANHYFQNFTNTFINSDRREEAAFMSAYSSYKQSPSYRLDQEYTQKAIESFQTFVNTYPRSERVDECNKLIDELREKLEKKKFEEGRLYYNLQNYQSANQSFTNLLNEFPDTKNGEEIRHLMVLSGYNLAKNSVYEKRKDRYEETIELGERFLKKYRKSQYRRDVQKIISESKSEIKELAYE